jgi:hypothetical protein
MQAVRIILDRGLTRGAPARLYIGTVIVLRAFLSVYLRTFYDTVLCTGRYLC